jgi:ferredoxin
MAYKVTDACVNCGACDAECPVEAISEKNGVRWIDPDLCTDCGACASVCPTEAIIQADPIPVHMV